MSEGMDEKTREALEGSIRKWEAIVAGTGIDDGGHNCPLCQQFWNPDDNRCNGCPVKMVTGRSLCEATPYTRWLSQNGDCVHASHPAFDPESDDDRASMANECPECRTAATAELDFLKSLRPPHPLSEETN